MLVRLSCSTAFFLFLAQTLLGAQPSELAKLRQEIALYYFEPASHIALAKYYHDRGSRLQAFLILEYVRHGLFSRAQFDAAFSQAFHKREPFDNSKEAEVNLVKKHAQDPKDADVAFKLADIYISRSDWPKAKEFLGKVIELQPEDFTHVEGLGEVLKEEGKPAEARKVVEEFLAKYPESAEAYRRKIGALMKTDAAQASKLLDQAIQKHPKDGGFLFNKAVLLQNENKLKEAEEHFVKSAALSKDSAYIQGWTGRFFLKVRQDSTKSLTYYLNAYFLDPHFRDTEYAEGRIGTLSSETARKEVAEALQAGKPVESLLQSPNPVVVGMAVDQMGKQWNPKFTKAMVATLGHDDEYVRAKALRALQANIDKYFDTELEALLKDSDLRKRGLAGYLAVKHWGKKGVDTVGTWLKEDVQLLRYDAVSALLQDGGEEGRKRIQEYRGREKHPWMKLYLERAEKKD